MEFGKLIDLATKLDVPGLAERGLKIARDAAFAALVKTNAARSTHVLAAGERRFERDPCRGTGSGRHARRQARHRRAPLTPSRKELR
jgi:hypothetical protein